MCANTILAQDLGAEAQEGIIMIFEELFSITNI